MTALATVERFLRGHPDLGTIAGDSLAKSLRRVLGDNSLHEVSPDAKAMIGSVLEGFFLPAMGLPKRDKGTDTEIFGVEVDMKHSIGTSWMVGPECVGHICMLFQTDFEKQKFSVGIIEATPDNLTKGKNRDQKVSFNSTGKKNINWIIREKDIPELPKSTEDRLFEIEKKLDLILSKL